MGKHSLPEIISNRYRIIRELGHGAVGIVYLVEDNLMYNMHFALKTLKPGILGKKKQKKIEGFKNEYEIMTRLKHPNLARVYEFGESDDICFILMEYIDGSLISGYKAGDREKIDILVQILRALEYAHSRGIVYRDVKPGNIIISADGVKLLDFGISGFAEHKHRNIKGTISYLSPDAFAGKYSYSTDIFSLGILAYEFISGKRFYDRKTELKTIIELLNKKSRFQKYHKDRLDSINHPMKDIIRRMVSLDYPYRTCSEVISDINATLGFNYEYETKSTRDSYILGNAFSNRKKELELLKKGVKKPEGLLAFRGPSGVGKTRLFTEFKKYCRLNKIHFFETSCAEGRTMEYSSIGEILSGMITFSRKDLLNVYGKYLSLVVNSRLLKDYPREPGDYKPDYLQNILIQNITNYIIDFSKTQPTVLYFGDMQWIDAGSELIVKILLNRLSELNNNGLFLCANFDESKSKKTFMNSSCLQIYDLHPLDLEGVHEYIENIFGKDFLDESVKNAVPGIKSKVGGNPLFLEEFIRSLIDREIIVKDESCWKLLKPLNDVDVPGNISDIISKRLDNLFKDEDRRKILKVLSMLRIELDIGTIRKIIDRVAELDTAKVLLELENLELLQSFKSEDSVYYSFCSSLVKDQVKNFIDNKGEVNLLLADVLKSHDPSYYADEIAFHYLEGGDEEQSAVFYEKSADTARKNYFNEKALKYYNTALGLTKDIERATGIRLKMGTVYDLTGDWEKSESLYKECIKDSVREENRKLLMESYRLLGNRKRNRGCYADALSYLEESLMISRAVGDKTATASIASYIGLTYYDLGEYPGALQYYQQAKDLFEEMGEKSGMANVMGNMAGVYHAQGQYERALECLEFQRDITAQTGSKKEMGMVLGNLGNVYVSMDRYQEALACYGECMKIAEQIGDKLAIGRTSCNMGVVYNSIGQYDKALKYYEIDKEICRDTGYTKGIGIASANMGLAYLSLGDYNKASECFEILQKIAKDTGNKEETAMAYGYSARIHMEKCNTARALENLDIAIELYKEMDLQNTSYLYCLINKSKTLLDMGRTEEAGQCSNEAVMLADRISSPEGRFETELLDCLVRSYTDKEESVRSLLSMMSPDLRREQTAEIYYTLYRIDRIDECRKSALQIYRSLYSETGKHQYRLKIDELEKSSS